MEFDLIIALGGLTIGLLVGLTGMGGGALMTPFLILMGVRPVVAVGTDLVQMTITKAFGSWQHYRQHTIDQKLVLFLALGSVPGALMGVGVLVLLRDVMGVAIDILITRLLGGALLLVALALFFRIRHMASETEEQPVDGPVQLSSRQKRLLPLLGAVVGLLVGISSVGSGSLFLVVLTFMFRMRMTRVVGTDLVHAMVLTASAGLAHMGVGNVDFGLAANVLAGTIPGVLIGSRLGFRLPDKSLRAIVVVVLVAVGIKLL